jgi:hypothetical protein
MADKPRRPTKVILDQAARQIADGVAKAYQEPGQPARRPTGRIPRSPKKPDGPRAKPGMSDPAARRLEAETLTPTARKTITARPQQEPVETAKVGILYGGKCKRCEQAVRVHIKPVEGTFQLMNFYDVRCACKGHVTIGLIGPGTYQEFAGLQPKSEYGDMREKDANTDD